MNNSIPQIYSQQWLNMVKRLVAEGKKHCFKAPEKVSPSGNPVSRYGEVKLTESQRARFQMYLALIA